MSTRGEPSISKSALLLSPCLAWANKKAKWYDERLADTTDRDLGTEFHRLIDQFIRDGGQELTSPTEKG